MAALVVRFRIDFAENSFVGPRKIRLLEAIRVSGSLAQGARNIGMSYRHAWLSVESLKRSFREPVTEIHDGGKGFSCVPALRPMQQALPAPRFR
jgi:molybdenum-dependent DNA-binding transcriptional regulator ModE